MKTFKNPSTSLWFVDLKEDHKLRKYIPMNFFQLINNSNFTASIYLNGGFFGEAQPYSPFNVVGAQFETFKILNAGNQAFNENELIVQVSKDVSVSALPANPQIDLLQDDLDTYASGCNDRISYGGGIDAEMIKYWVNVQNQLIVQRRLELEGSASLGQYDILFNSIDDLAGSVGINSITTIEKRIKKTISGSLMDYSVTNCSISGWMIDLSKKTGDISPTYSIITGGSIAANAYDDNMSSFFTDTDNVGNNWTYVTIWEVSFSSFTIHEIHLLWQLYCENAEAHAVKLQKYDDGSWIDVFVYQKSTAPYAYLAHHSITRTDTDVTGLRIQISAARAGTLSVSAKIHDISVF